MKDLFLNIVGFLTAVIFLLSTSGFTIYSHHCSHNGISYSVLIENHRLDGDVCNYNQKKEIISCCSEKKPCSIKTDPNTECCDNFKEFVIADINLAGTNSINNPEIQCLKLLNISNYKKHNCSNELIDNIIDNQVQPYPILIPKLSMVIFLNTLKILPDPFS
ncbi:MAG: hypothetical protein CMF58_07980 [Lentimicrobiaceae bacterium]|nr:hypothetical protein [Lentimicrobiaceae bacterium]